MPDVKLIIIKNIMAIVDTFDVHHVTSLPYRFANLSPTRYALPENHSDRLLTLYMVVVTYSGTFKSMF